MRSFSATYLEATREGMWDDSRAALAPLALGSQSRILDVGCGTGEFSRVLREESDATVFCLDADRELLARARAYGEPILADGTRLPVHADSMDLVVCQAFLVNVADPSTTLSEFSRVSDNLVAAIEPDNEAVTVESTVDAEPMLAARSRTAYLDGVSVPATLSASTLAEYFRTAGLDQVTVRRYEHVREVSPPYSEQALTTARQQATGSNLATDRETLAAGGLSDVEYDQLRRRWRSVGRKIVDQMQADTYRRRETVPFSVVVGQT